ncbi:phosphopentomutase-like [Uloborus diversus]|uniref:phosphopentomutase-like n=1 Tax=Uloborus diversus TaxID=327109 RepID=UPI00240A02AA|nr:phosphopentomutase-like [Uloborus diversus]
MAMNPTDALIDESSPVMLNPRTHEILNFEIPNEDLKLKVRNYIISNLAVGHTSHEAQLMDMLNKHDYKGLNEIMMKRLTFGTAGIRGRVGIGFSAMNNVVVVQTTQGIAALLANEDKTKGVVIGYDNRNNSKEFAELTATVFLKQGFVVYFFSGMVPTPFIPFSVKKLNCLLGIIITASHNPKQDNGYKVYGPNSTQILPEFAERIQKSILKNLVVNITSKDKLLIHTSTFLHDPLADMDHLYFEDLISSVNTKCLSHTAIKITTTALHGVGHPFLKKALQKSGYYKWFPVPSQMHPDGDFPTVKFPNPEEKDCLAMAIAISDEKECSLILANDPDADRLAVAEKLHDKTWHIYSGNEIGALLGSWLWKKCPAEKKIIPSNCCMISSTVSSKILRSIAQKEGFTFYETLTGFKYMANKAAQAEERGLHFVFAFEEAIGYMCSTSVMDKDGIRAALLVFELAAYAEREHKLLYDVLKETYLTYGYHFALNSYFICPDPQNANKMFHNLRHWNGKRETYPDHLDLPRDRKDISFKYEVVHVRDLTTGYDSRTPTKLSTLPTDPSTQMITFYFGNGAEATLRTSGTEPKVKYYTEAIHHGPESEWQSCRDMLSLLVELMVQQWMQPLKHSLLSRPEEASKK